MSKKAGSVVVPYSVEATIDRDELVRMVKSRLGSMAMCKRGVLESEKNERYDKLGKVPHYTKEEREILDKGLNKKIQKACSVTLKMVEAAPNTSGLLHMIQARINKIRNGAYNHPDAPKWESKKKRIELEFKEREAQLDGDFKEMEDNFIFGFIELSRLPNELKKLEERVW